MGVAIPQIITEDRASGALIVDGSLRFDSGKSQYLSRTPSSSGNQTTWTWSGWIKRIKTGEQGRIFNVGSSSGSPVQTAVYFTTSDTLQIEQYQGSGTNYYYATSSAVYRDTSSWMHIVAVWDTNNSTSTDTLRLYVNGQRITSLSASAFPTSGFAGQINTTNTHYLGTASNGLAFTGQLTNLYFIDGQALDASYFGYTDALTNTWRPKKLSSSVAFGTNGFYLPFDGSAPIGQDQSGRGNNWTPVNFGGSNTLEKATGALPILNTDGGGKVARVGVRTDSSASSLVLALPLVGIKSDFSNAVNSGTSNKAITANGNAAASSVQSNFYGGSFYFDGTGDYLQTTVETLSGDFCVEGWWYPSSSGQQTFFTLGDSATSTGIQLYRSSSSSNLIIFGSAGSIISSGVDYTLNKWQHFALTRSGTSLRLFKDGIQIGSTVTNSTAFNSTLRIGVEVYSSTLAQYLTGYVQDFRVYNGTAKYTQNFIPASTDPDILPDTPSGVAYSSNVTPITDGTVAFDGTRDYMTVASSNDFEFGSGDFTVEFFTYINSHPGSTTWISRDMWDGGAGGAPWVIYYYNGTINFSVTQTAGSWAISGAGQLLLSSKVWNHVALVRNGNSFDLYVNGIKGTTGTFSGSIEATSNPLVIGGYSDGSLGNVDGFISNLHIVKGTALYTSNFTPPTAPISSVANTKLLCCKSNSSVTAADVTPGSILFPGSSISAFRDSTSSNQTWDNSSVSSSTSQALGPDDIYWSDLAETCTVTTVTFTVNVSSSTNITLTNFILYYSTASNSTGSSACSSGCTTTVTPTYTGSAPGNVYVTFSGLNLSARYLGITNGSGTYSGTLTYSNVVITVDAPAPTNFNPFTANINTQRGKQSGWCTWNPLDTAGSTLSNGNLNITTPSTGLGATRGTIGVSSGKWYYEHTITSGSTAIGIMKLTDALVSGSGIIGASAGGYSYYSEGVAGGGYTKKINNGTQTDYGASFDPGDTISVAFDLDAGTITFYKNGISQGVAFSGLSGTFSAAISDGTNAGSIVGASNFGQKPFKFPPPAGFQPLALANTPRPTIVRPDQYMGVTTYTGTGAASRPVTNLGFKPDFVWIKNRSSGSYSHQLFDSVRGASAGCLYSDLTNAQDSNFPITSFDTSGFTLGSSASLASQSYASQNGSGSNYVAWTWKAGGNSNTYNINDVGYATASAAGLTAGTITPTGASVNTKSGFSIVSWTATGSVSTLSHGLGAKPKLIINKSRSASDDWAVITDMVSGSLQYLYLNSTQAINNTGWGTSPTSSVMSVYSYSAGQTMISYCWAEIPGFSKFGSYTGNNSTDGPVIITGFKPRWIMIKRTDSSDDWQIRDTTLNTYNPMQKTLFANLAQAEVTLTDRDYDILSNGFKIRGTDVEINASGGTYIYAAWAETPSFNLYGAQSNAR